MVPHFASPRIAFDRSFRIRAIVPSGAVVRYSLDGRDPTELAPEIGDGIEIDRSAVVSLRAFASDGAGPTVRRSYYHAYIGVATALETQPHPEYRSLGPVVLTDGLTGEPDPTDGLWMGFSDGRFAARFDLGEPKRVLRVSPGFLHRPELKIFAPQRVQVESSDNLRDWRPVEPQLRPEGQEVWRPEFVLNRIARYFRVAAEGGEGLAFVDEVVLERG